MAAAVAARAEALARHNRDDRRHAGSGDGYLATGNRAGERGIVFAAAAGTAGIYLLDFVLTGRQAGNDQRLVKLRTAACAQGEGFTAGVARAGEADGERARRAALVAARLQQNLMDDQRRALVIMRVCAAEVRRIAQKRMFPLRERTVGMSHAITGIERMQARHHMPPP